MNEYLRDAIRLLFVLSEGSRPLAEPDGGATHIFRGEARLHALDFWMRYPGLSRPRTQLIAARFACRRA
jgi:hypothetical protein